MSFGELADPHYLDRAACATALEGRAPPGAWTGLYVAGSLAALALPVVGVVGSRAPSPAGRRLAFRLAADLADAGVCVLSGLALGIDAAAHEGALTAAAPTIGVLGGGHRRFFPRANRELAERMLASGGAVISPYPPDHAAFPSQFLERNGLVAALCDAVVVVEAATRSGALNTAAWASERGIPVLAFPGDVDRPKVAGCLALIRDGATLARDARDVLAALPAGSRVPLRRGDPPGALRTVPAPPPRGLTPLAAEVVALLADGERHVDHLIEGAGAPAAAVLATLTELEIAGHVHVERGVAALTANRCPKPRPAPAPSAKRGAARSGARPERT